MAESFQDVARRHPGVNSDPAEAWHWIENPQTDAQRAVVEHMRKHEWRYAERWIPGDPAMETLGRGEGVWVRCEIEELKVGDRFRSFEPDGTPVLDTAGHSEFIAITAPSRIPDQPGNYVLNINPAEAAPESLKNA